MFDGTSLSYRFFSAAQSSLKRQLRDDDWVRIPTFDLGGIRKGLGDVFFLLATERQMFDWRGSIWTFLRQNSFPFQDLTLWHDHQETFDSIYNQFFGKYTGDPAFVWATPCWYDSGFSLRLSRAGIMKRYVYRCERVGLRSSLPIWSGSGRCHLKLPLKNLDDHNGHLFTLEDETGDLEFFRSRCVRMVEIGSNMISALGIHEDILLAPAHEIHKMAYNTELTKHIIQSDSPSICWDRYFLTFGVVRGTPGCPENEPVVSYVSIGFFPHTGAVHHVMTVKAYLEPFVLQHVGFKLALHKMHPTSRI